MAQESQIIANMHRGGPRRHFASLFLNGECPCALWPTQPLPTSPLCTDLHSATFRFSARPSMREQNSGPLSKHRLSRRPCSSITSPHGPTKAARDAGLSHQASSQPHRTIPATDYKGIPASTKHGFHGRLRDQCPNAHWFDMLSIWSCARSCREHAELPRE